MRSKVFGIGKFDFTQILSNSPKFYPNLRKSNQILPKFARGCRCIPCIPSSYGTICF